MPWSADVGTRAETSRSPTRNQTGPEDQNARVASQLGKTDRGFLHRFHSNLFKVN